jgi:hypothetical protein
MRSLHHASSVRILKPIRIRFLKSVCDVGCMHSSGPQFLDELGAAQRDRTVPFLLNMGRRHVGQVPVSYFFDFDHAVVVPSIRVSTLSSVIRSRISRGQTGHSPISGNECDSRLSRIRDRHLASACSPGCQWTQSRLLQPFHEVCSS